MIRLISVTRARLKTGIENLIFYGIVFGKSVEDSKKRGLYLLEKLELLYAKDQKLETYSTGMRQRLSLARALIHNPQVHIANR